MIKRMTRSEIVFELDGRTATIQGEALVPEPGQPSFIIYADSLKSWDEGSRDRQMTAEDRRRVLHGAMEALRDRGTPFEIEGEEAPVDGLPLDTPSGVLAGEYCPRAGYWFTPAVTGSRRSFKAGEVMPSARSDYGATVWQWDEQQ
jgi:hypothetical protein